MDTHVVPRSLSAAAVRRPVAAAAALLLVTALPATAPAQRAAPEQAVRRVEEAYGAEVARSVENLARSLRERGVPAAPIRDRALEGIAKQVPAESFVVGLRSYGKRLARASEALPQPAGTSTVVAAADAIQGGVPPEVVRELAGRTAGRREVVGALPLVVLADLAGAGVPVDQALSVVRSALGRGLGPRQMLATSGAVRDLIRQGRVPAAAARTVERTLGTGRLPTSVPNGLSPPAGLPVSGGAPIPPGAAPPHQRLPRTNRIVLCASS